MVFVTRGDKYVMIIAKITSESDVPANMCIPAYLEDGKLVIGHNGSSMLYSQPDTDRLIAFVKASDFVYFASHKCKGALVSKPYYLYNGIPYTLVSAITGNTNSRRVIYTYLAPCYPGTYFCKCNDCGTKYVIDSFEAKYYEEKNLSLPTVRCPSCRVKRKHRKGIK